MKTERHRTASADETLELGRRLARELGPRGMVWLDGPLGAGKTVVAKGLFAELGVDPDEVVSPTFTFINRYRERPLLHHVDLYRLERAADVVDLGLDDVVELPGLVVVEWGERLGDRYGVPDLAVRLEPTGDDERDIEVVWRDR